MGKKENIFLFLILLISFIESILSQLINSGINYQVILKLLGKIILTKTTTILNDDSPSTNIISNLEGKAEIYLSGFNFDVKTLIKILILFLFLSI